MLEPAVIEQPEVVVTGSAFTTEQSTSSVPVVPIDRIQIHSAGATNIVNAIATTPGVSTISTGSAISKPVIRGLSYTRIVVVNEGVRQEGQQWGDEHGLEIDEYDADKIEVLKGPSSLLYGSDALGGVINILEPVPPPPGKFRGELDSRYSTNNGLSANSLLLEGNKNGWVGRARGTFKNSAPYRTPAERIYNSAFHELNGEGLIGVNRSWGYSHLHASVWNSAIGIVEGERDSVTGKLLNHEGGVATENELKSRELNVPFQEVSHEKFSLVNNIIIGHSQLRLNGGWQQNDRKEFIKSGAGPGLWFHLNTVTYDAKYYFPEIDSIQTVVGFSGMNQQNTNLGMEFLIPDYSLNDWGAFGSIKKSYSRLTLNGGIRYDQRSISGKSLINDGKKIFSGFATAFSAFSGSVGATFQFSTALHLKANAGRGFRAPNIAELSSNGVHEGTFRYELGNPNLRPETSLQLDAGIGGQWKKFTFTLDAFYNDISHFIYFRNLNHETIASDSNTYPLFICTQGNSSLRGFELSFDLHPIQSLHFEGSMAYVEGRNLQEDTPLPFVPPVKIENELRYNFRNSKSSRLNESYVKISVINVLGQDRIDPEFESKTEGYTLVDAGLGTNLRIGKQELQIFIVAANVTDKLYYNHLSRLKEVGIAEMGRNITIGISLPLSLR